MQNHEIPYTTATRSNVEDAALSANRNDKRILDFYLKIKNMQNHEILHTTATWGSVEDALEPARKLSVLAKRHTKMDAYFCVFRATNFEKKHKNAKSWNPLYYGDTEQCGRRCFFSKPQ